MDGLGASIRVDTRFREVMRILPRVNDAVNEEWISDKTRQVVDGLKARRLDHPLVRVDGKLKRASWPDAFAAIAAKVRGAAPDRVGAIAGDLCAVEDMFALQSLMGALGSPNLDCRQDGAKLDPALGRASYLFNATVQGIEQADALLIIGSNPRRESPVLNARIRKRWLRGNFPIGVIGEHHDLTYPYTYLGAGPDTLGDLPHDFADLLKNAERPLVLVGQGALARPDGAAVLGRAAALAGAMATTAWRGLSVLHTAAARVGGLDLGFVPGAGGLDAAAMARGGGVDVLFLLGADEIAVEPGAFTVYIGTHGDRGASRADVVLPAATYTEKSGIYVNTEGRVQLAERANFPPGDAREDWAILRALSDALGHRLPFDSLAQLRGKLFAAHPHMARFDDIAEGPAADLSMLGERPLGEGALVSPVTDFYLTNPIARASRTMAEASALANSRGQGAQMLQAAE